MKLFAKLILALLVLALLLPFAILKDDAGKPMLSFSDFKLPSFSFDAKLPDVKGLAKSADGDIGGKDIFYQWYDSEGNIQFSTEPPPEGVEYTIKGYDPDANVIQAVKPRPRDEESDDAQDGVTTGKRDLDEIGNPYSQENIQKLFEDAKNIEKMLTERLQQQNDALNQ